MRRFAPERFTPCHGTDFVQILHWEIAGVESWGVHNMLRIRVCAAHMVGF